MDVLYWYYEESRSYSDVIGQLVKRFSDSNFKPKYRIDVILQLLQQVRCHFFIWLKAQNVGNFIYFWLKIPSNLKDIINRSEFNALMKYENVEIERNFQLKPTVRTADEPTDSASGSVCPQSKTEKTHDCIQVFFKRALHSLQFPKISKICFVAQTKFLSFSRFSKSDFCVKIRANILLGCKRFWLNIVLPNCVLSKMILLQKIEMI